MATSISDLPFKDTKDDFQTKNYVDGLVRFIRNAQAPLTIALQGEWGSGKTSLMTRLYRELCNGEKAPFIGVNINTWEFSMLASPEETVYNILGRLVKDVSKNDTNARKTFTKFLRRTARGLYRGGRELLKATPIGNLGSTVASVAVETLDLPTQIPFFSNDEEDATLSELRESLESAVRVRITEDHKNGIIVFVDDLDRLNPPVAVEILELLKNVFTLEHCIFVLAIDYEVVVKGLEPKFGKLTGKNEREFRSFFDKIIQVPFSLPVNSYHPMTFVFESLNKIGYLPENITITPEQEDAFEEIVSSSVGKNPRSIKRLINTLSLLDCIAQVKAENQTEDVSKTKSNILVNESNEVDSKLLNFIIVAIQICYPRIYSLLVHKPNFMEWNTEFAAREGIQFTSHDGSNDIDWTDILEASCNADKYLAQRYTDITRLFSMISDIISHSEGNLVDNIGSRLKDILDKTAITGVSTNIVGEDFDKKSLISRLYENVSARIHQLRPDIDRIDVMKNTGNGGYRFYIDNRKYEVKFLPSQNTGKNNISLKIEMSTQIPRSEELMHKTIDVLLLDSRLKEAIVKLDEKISPLLSLGTFFAGKTFNSRDSWFHTYSDELRFYHEQGHMSGDVTHKAEYWINLPKSSDFEDPRITDALAQVVIANYDFRKTLLK